ncbi:unnamed protein product, partial [Pararhodospirillum photometricum DSM 122]
SPGSRLACPTCASDYGTRNGYLMSRSRQAFMLAPVAGHRGLRAGQTWRGTPSPFALGYAVTPPWCWSMVRCKYTSTTTARLAAFWRYTTRGAPSPRRGASRP